MTRSANYEHGFNSDIVCWLGMPSRTVFPQICIALGFEDVEALLSHARNEYDAGERFLEFRLDYLPSPEHGVAAIRKFLARHSDCACSPPAAATRITDASTAASRSRSAFWKPRAMPAPRPWTSKSRARRTAPTAWPACAPAACC